MYPSCTYKWVVGASVSKLDKGRLALPALISRHRNTAAPIPGKYRIIVNEIGNFNVILFYTLPRRKADSINKGPNTK